MSWFNRLQAQPQGIAQQAQNLLIPDPDNSVDDDNANLPEQPPEIMPAVNYDAHHADDEADNAMDKAINALKNKAWSEDDLKFYFAQVKIQMKKAGKGRT